MAAGALAMHLQSNRPSPTGLLAGERRTFVAPAAQAVSLVSGEMAEVGRILPDLLRSDVEAVSEIGRYLAESGGKRLRPLLTALGARAAGNLRPIARLMCVGELLHLGSLLHDDVVDDGLERRGRPAAQRVFGNAAVILTGDHCVSTGILIAAEEAGLDAVTELARVVTSMSEGEVTQLLNAGNLDIDLHTYFEVIDKKSASLISWCAAAGAWAVEDQEAAAALARFGRHVGLAFQITDDVLDYTGDKVLTGKQRGQDLAQCKPTLPLLLAMERVPDLKAELAAGAPSPDRIPGLMASVHACGATQDALQQAHGHVADGLEALACLPMSPARQSLESLAHHLVERVS
jgi:octaprenyl-diphosphate synthase